MEMNSAMRFFLRGIDLKQIVDSSDYPIVCHRNTEIEAFWTVEDRRIPPDLFTRTPKELTDLEWDKNEVHIDENGNFDGMLREALGVAGQWETQMTREFPAQIFDIILSIDYGDEDIEPSSTIRFYAIRENYRIIQKDWLNLEKFVQPILVQTINKE